ncbi:MAG: hypothetical protein D6725_06155 [Planctomycetota bacterium]|nr:MAG: hypothetical protein D6725_06155 [Planctomycetota bacterium]
MCDSGSIAARDDERTLDVLLVVPADSAPADRLSALVLRACAPCRIHSFRSLSEVLRVAPARWIPDVAVVYEPFPGATDARTMVAAFQRWPLTRWVCAAGPWCESAMRRGTAWPPSVWCPLGRLEQRLVAERSALRLGTPVVPLTAERDEVVLFECPEATGARWVHREAAGEAEPARVGDAAQATGVSFFVAAADPALRELIAMSIRDTGGWVAWCGIDPEEFIAAPAADGARAEPAGRGIWVWDVDPWSGSRARTAFELARRRASGVWMLTGEPDPDSVIGCRFPQFEIVAKLAVAFEIPRRVRALVGEADAV